MVITSLKRQQLFIFLFLVALFSIHFVQAQPPFIVSTQGGIEVSFPKIDNFISNQSYTLPFIVSNGSSLLTNETTSCFFRLANQQGLVYANNSLPYSSNRFFVVVPATNFSFVGDYGYAVFCNTSNQVGFISNPIFVTKIGSLLTPQVATMSWTSLIFMFILFLMAITGFIITPWRNVIDDGGQLISVNEFKWLKLVLGFVSYYLLFIMITMLYEYTYAYTSLVSFNAYFGLIHTILLGLMFPLILITVVGIIWSIVYQRKLSKELEQGLLQ